MPQNTELQDGITHLSLDLPHTKPAYRERLNAWAIARLLPNLEPHVVARFRSRSDADGYLDSLRQRMPNDQFIVTFAPQHAES
ncbi:hypothetical protein H6G89_03005 [Oscillatoria sp. FACHB-1407]|uniref:hypothetical protein n=1 Tax=Oscillatoria sp. FACHB-1407 TaxID=2692847 RepID=UPI0016838659|nr:hypothetical protein [Oscillatoria sp. FACHB-1407]MBD2460004.1 hypothetical protein [Oscillatoria sp. FACHB-1407]